MYFLSGQQQQEIAEVFSSAGNFIEYVPDKETCVRRLTDLLGHSSLSDIAGKSLLFYYHHRRKTRDVYTVYMLFYDSAFDSFTEYTLYDWDCDVQRKRPGLQDFKKKEYSATMYHEFYTAKLKEGDIRYPLHHTDNVNTDAYENVVLRVLNIMDDVEFEPCEL